MVAPLTGESSDRPSPRPSPKTVGVLLAGMVAAMTSSAAAHPHHTSRGEARLNPATGNLEVSIAVSIDAIDRAIAGRHRDPHRWRSRSSTHAASHRGSKRVEGALAIYLAQNFAVTTPSGKAKLRFVGWEPEGQQIWLHFEMLSVRSLNGATITHTLLMNVEPGQLNTLRLRSGPFKTSLIFDREHRQHTVETTTAAPSQ